MTLRAKRTVATGMMMLFSIVCHSKPSQLNIYIDAHPPYSFQKEGKNQGIAVEIKAEMLKRVGSTQSTNDFMLVPWADGYKALETDENTVLFPTTQTKDRMNKFKRVCSIAQRHTELVGLKASQIKISSSGDMKNYTYAAVVDDVGEQIIKAANVPDHMILGTSDYVTYTKQLFIGKAQLVASNIINTREHARESGFNPDELEAVFLVDTSQPCYAFYKATDTKKC